MSGANDTFGALVMRLRRHPVLFATIFAGVIGIVMGLETIIVPQYTAATGVIIEPDRATMDQRRAATDNPAADFAEIESQMAIIRSPRLTHAILRRPEVVDSLTKACEYDKAHSKFTAVFDYLDRLRRWMGKPTGEPCQFDTRLAEAGVNSRFGVFEVGRSRVISVTFESSLPDTAASLANALVREYLDDNVAARSRTRLEAAQWLQAEAAKLSEEVAGEERQIDEYKRAHGVLRGQTGLISQESLSSLILQHAQAQSRLAEATARLNSVKAVANDVEKLATLPEVVTSPTIRDLRAHESTVRGQLAELEAKNFGPKYPKVMDAQAQLADVQAAMTAEGKRIIASLQADVASASANERSLRQALDSAKGSAADLTDADSVVQALARDVEIKTKLYQQDASRAMELQTEARAQSPNASLVNVAGIPFNPSFPHTIPFAGGAFVLAFVLASIAAFGRDYMDRTLRSIEDITRQHVSILAHVPSARRLFQDRRDGFLAQLGQDPSAYREAIRTLFGHLRLRAAKRTLLITSSSPQEGKTTLAVSLAHFAAAAGQRVLLIEADLRMPTFDTIISGLRGGHGLEAFLRGIADWPDVIETPDPNVPTFHVVPAGRAVQDSTELLSGRRMASLIRDSGEIFDFVIIDTPPIHPVVDACVLARWVDGVIYVARWGRSSSALVTHGMNTIRNAGGEILGVVLGMVQMKWYGMYNATGTTGTRPYIAAS